MSNAPDNPRNPGPLSEEQLVDWIDGALPQGHAERLLAASGRPDLKDRIAEMQRHRRILASLPEEQAPPELFDRVMAALERDALIGIAAGVDEATLPEDRSALTLSGRTRSRTFWQRTTPRLAMAAGVALFVVGASYFAALVLTGKKQPGTLPSGPVASSTTSAAPAEDQAKPFSVAAAPEAGSDVAKESDAVAVRQQNAAESTGPAREGAADEAVLARGPEDRTLELARQGRLVVRVVAKDTRALHEIEESASGPASERQWRLDREVPADVVAAVLPGGMTQRQVPGPTLDGQPLVVAAATRSKASLVGPYIGPGAAARLTAPAPDDSVAKVRGTYLVDLPRTERGFNVIRTVFQDRLKAQVIFEESPAPLNVPQQTTPEQLLWWTQPSGQWVDRVTVPLVVEQG